MGEQSEILVTGDTGFIGSFLTKKLKELDHNVEGLNTSNGDILDKNQVNEIIKGKDYVFHLAGISSPSFAEMNPKTSFMVNVIGMQNVINACRHHGAKLIFSSTRLIYGNTAYPALEQDFGNPTTIYGIDKRFAESFCDAEKDFIVRLTSIYGPSKRCHSVIPRFIQSIKSNREIVVYEDDMSSRDYCYIDDAVDALLLGMKHSGIYNVGTGVQTTIDELLAIISETLDMPYRTVYKKQEACGVERTLIDLSNIKKIGWSPKIDLKGGIRRVVEWSSREQEAYHRTTG